MMPKKEYDFLKVGRLLKYTPSYNKWRFIVKTFFNK
jgi:hypothetical protein